MTFVLMEDDKVIRSGSLQEYNLVQVLAYSFIPWGVEYWMYDRFNRP